MDHSTNTPSTTLGNSERVTRSPETEYDKYTGWFWTMVAFYVCIAVVTAIGNGLVIYAAYGNRNTGRLRYLDDVIKSLAVADMLFGLIGTPFLLVSYYMGEYLWLIIRNE